MQDEVEMRTEELARWTVERSKSLGADCASAEVSHDKGLSVTVRMGEVDAVEHTEERVLTLNAWIGGRKGCASTADFSERSLEAAVQAAVDIARVSAEDPAAGLPEAEDLQADMRDLSLWHPFEGGVQEAVRLASAVEEAVFEADERIVNSDGIAEDDSGMQRDGWWTQGRAVEDLLDPAELGRTAAGRTVARLGARPLSSRRARVLFDAPVATGLLDILEELLNGRAWYRHASCLEGRLGERILPAHVSVEEDPYLMRALGSGVFDDEGCAGRRRMIVSDGRIEGIFLSSYSARRLGMRTTGNLGGAYNLRLSSTETRPEDTRRAMLERLGTGFLVTELIGQGLNAVSGDYSRGASGFWVENGRIVAPVEGVTIASNILTMMKTIEAIGADEHDTGVRRSGSLLIPDLMLAGE